MSIKFHITKLIITGHNKVPAKIEFCKGLNVIAGPSNTGKSHILECIDFMFGGKTRPEEIPEAKGYDTIFLELETDSSFYTLKRSIEGGNFHIKEGSYISNEEYQEYKDILSNDANNISTFLLSLCGLENGIQLKTNSRNTKNRLSFRNIAGLILIDEEKVITKRSPIFSSGANTEETKEISLFNFLLTGADASNLVEIEDPKIRKSRIGGQIDFVSEMIERKELALENYKDLDVQDVEKKIEDIYEKLNLEYKTSQEKIDYLRNERSSFYVQLQDVESKLLFNNELLDRFRLLDSHYESDIKRLDFISEGSFLVNQLSDVNCPICGGSITEGHTHHLKSAYSQNANFDQSVLAELEKLKMKKVELNKTSIQIQADNKKLKSKRGAFREKIDEFDYSLQNSLEPVSATLKERLSQISNLKVRYNSFSALKSEIRLLNNRKQELLLQQKIKEKANSEILNFGGKINKFCEEIERVLKNWNFPDTKKIVFDPSTKVFDIILGGKKRSANGKGYRALTYTAFLYSLMNFSIKENGNHPGLFIIDSPLTTFKDIDLAEDEEYANERTESMELVRGVEDSFFSDLAIASKDKQVIIIENKIPKEELRSKINFIQFTRDKNHGRYGFFSV